MNIKIFSSLENARTGGLKIVRSSHQSAAVTGGDTIVLLVEKVDKTDISVRFYETDILNDEPHWMDWAKFNQTDVHHQYAISLVVPPYKTLNISSPREVMIQLHRPSDNFSSSPIPFNYLPLNNNWMEFDYFIS